VRRIGDSENSRISKDRRCQLERDTVFVKVNRRLRVIPFELELVSIQADALLSCYTATLLAGLHWQIESSLKDLAALPRGRAARAVTAAGPTSSPAHSLPELINGVP
jgi:hypothetical protein